MRYREIQTLATRPRSYWRDGQDVTQFDSVRKMVVLADACPLLWERPETFYSTITVPVIFG